jgi:hypothetical protein
MAQGKEHPNQFKIAVLYRDAVEAFLQTPPERNKPKKKVKKKRG